MRTLLADTRSRLALGALAGAVAGLALASVGAPQYEARATLLVAHGTQLPKSSEEARQAARTVADLAESETVGRSVADTLGIARPGIRASADGSSGLVVVRVRQRSKVRAVRATQQAGLVVSQLVSTRLAGSGLRATIWDPARDAHAVRPVIARDVLLGALAGLLAVAAWWASTRRRGAAATATAMAEPDPDPRPRLRPQPQPVEPVGEPPPPPPPPPVPPRPEPEPEPELEPEPKPKPKPKPEPEPEHPVVLEPAPGRFSVVALERLVATAPLGPRRAEELQAYLAAFRGQEDEHGLLPVSLEQVVHEIFGELVER